MRRLALGGTVDEMPVGTRTFALSALTPLGCTISGASTTCKNTDVSAAIAGSSALSLEVTSTGSVPTLSLFVGFEGR